ncbi:MAG: VWA domain-containing protein [bacterium]
MTDLMIAWQNFHFLYPLWFFALIPVLFVLAWFTYQQQRQSLVHRLVDPKLAPFILSPSQHTPRKHLLGGIAVLSLIAVTALAGPSWQQIKQHSFQKQQALVILFDLSTSMYATDMKPDRLTRARFELIDLLNQRKEGQTGLIVYAGAPFVVSPLTDDVDTIQEQIKYLSPQDMPIQGSQLAFAVEKAVSLLKQAGLKEGQILAMSDGVSDLAATRQALNQARQQGYSTSIMAFGNTEGSPVPLPDGGFLKDNAGNIVIPRTDLESLQSLRQQGQGVFVQAQFNDNDLNQLLPQLSGSAFNKNLQENETRTIKTWRNEGIWLLILLIPFTLLLFRRGVLFSVILLGVILPHSNDIYAASTTSSSIWWEELWATPNQRAQQALENNDAKTAADTFVDPNWKAAANYRAGNYETAIKLYQQNNDVDSLYNLGNALAKAGQYEKAIKAYEKVLAQQANHEDAKYNLALLKKLQQQQNANQQQNNQQGEQSKSESQQNQQSDANRQNNSGQSQTDQAGSNQTDSRQQNAQNQPNDTSPEGDNADQMSQAQQQAKENAEKEREALEQAMAEAAQQANKVAETDEKTTAFTQNEQATEREQAQATQQWLRRIPDDPSGLWRRKFYYQYRQSAQRQGIGDQTQAW